MPDENLAEGLGVVADVGPGAGDRPSWMDDLVRELHPTGHERDAAMRQLREWLGLGIAALLVYLIASGLGSIRASQEQVDRTEIVTTKTKTALDRHIRSANEANMALATILRTIEGRTARLEGIEEERAHGDEH